MNFEIGARNGLQRAADRSLGASCDWLKGRSTARAPSLVERLDEAAQPLHDVIVVKLALTVLAGLGSMLILPWRHCLAWAAVGLVIEGWLWFASRSPPEGVALSCRRRLAFLAAYAANVVWWLLLGAQLWGTGETFAQATAAALFLTVAAVTVLLFYNVPIVFFFAGSGPAAGALGVMVQAEGDGLLAAGPIWIVLSLSALFCIGRALETPSAQASRRQLNAALDNYKTLAANVSDVIALTRLSGEFDYLSPSAQAVLGYPPEELVGVSRWTILHPDTDRAAIQAAYRRLCADPAGSETMLVRVRRRDGEWIWLQSSGRLLCEDGAPVAVIDVSRDVTAQVEAERALLAAKAEAESATLAKGEFLANVSHEIRTPMNGVLGALQLLESEPISDAGRELLQEAGSCGRMLAQLLNDVLDFSRIEAGQLELAPEPVSPARALKSVTALLESQARAKGVGLITRIEGEDQWVSADPVRLNQVIFNLVGNAVKFTQKGHVEARLAVHEIAPGRRRVRLEVEDTGIGIAPQALSGLFERFHQVEADTARRFGGAGLGLSITKALVSLMDGAIHCTSAPGVGSTFTIEFETDAALPPARPASETSELLNGVRILLVEDNPTNRLIEGTLLKRLGAEVHEADDGLVGAEVAARGDFDLILMDIQMPRMGGVESARAIRDVPGPRGRTPILALTANAMTHQIAEYVEAGMNGMIAKPIAAPALIDEILRVLGREELDA